MTMQTMTSSPPQSSSKGSRILRIGITGGIGSGKSYICHQLETAGFSVFYCDDEAKSIIRTDSEVKTALQELVGKEVYDTEGQLVKPILRAYLCKGNEYAEKVNAIVHPKVAERFNSKAEEMNEQATALAADWNQEEVAVRILSDAQHHICLGTLLSLPKQQTLFMECALLFESGFCHLVDTSVLVHVSQQTQLKRLMARDHISEEKAKEWIALQLPENEKMLRAGYILCNEQEDK